MAGTTGFRLGLDITGKPIRCEIVSSSGFDLLDEATCKRLVDKARFSPALDEAGKPTESTYASRVRWVMPTPFQLPVSESFTSLFVSVDQSGKVTSCRVEIRVPGGPADSAMPTCDGLLPSLSAMVPLALEGHVQAAPVEVEVQRAFVFTPELRSKLLAPVAGYDLLALNVHHFTVTSDGKVGKCSYEQQRGVAQLAGDFCEIAGNDTYDAPFAAFDKDGVANGWHFMRFLLKTSK